MRRLILPLTATLLALAACSPQSPAGAPSTSPASPAPSGPTQPAPTVIEESLLRWSEADDYPVGELHTPVFEAALFRDERSWRGMLDTVSPAFSDLSALRHRFPDARMPDFDDNVALVFDDTTCDGRYTVTAMGSGEVVLDHEQYDEDIDCKLNPGYAVHEIPLAALGVTDPGDVEFVDRSSEHPVSPPSALVIPATVTVEDDTDPALKEINVQLLDDAQFADWVGALPASVADPIEASAAATATGKLRAVGTRQACGQEATLLFVPDTAELVYSYNVLKEGETCADDGTRTAIDVFTIDEAQADAMRDKLTIRPRHD